MTTYIGIDPGLKGAISCKGPASDEPVVIPTPTTKVGSKLQYDIGSIVSIIWSLAHDGQCFAAVEKLHPMRLEHGGVQANYQRGRALAVWEVALVAAKIPYELVAPRTWQKVMHAGTPEGDTKERSIVAAKRLFPGVSLLPTTRCRKESDGMAEALLLMEYGRRRHSGTEAA